MQAIEKKAALTFPALTFQELLFTLQRFWADQGCVLQQPYDVEVGAGTMSPDTGSLCRSRAPPIYNHTYERFF